MVAMVPVAIGLGSNLGDAVEFVRCGQEFLTRLLRDAQHSRLVWSEPMYVSDQARFCNGVTIGWTEQSPIDLVASLKCHERNAGRTAGPRNGPREIDLDLLSYGRLAYRFKFEDGRDIVVPHQRIAERRFVIEPWAELDSSWWIPGLGTVGSLVAGLTDPDLVTIE